MAVYAIGDIQGCREPLERLLDAVSFDPSTDQIWFVGDLVNRGPDSLGVLRLVRAMGEGAVTVLGNHDIHLLAVWSGHGRLKPNDTLRSVLDAEDSDELMEWLRRRPLMHLDLGLGYAMVHAGLPPAWSVDEAVGYARELEAELGGDRFIDFMDHVYGNRPNEWSEDLSGYDRLRFITNAFTRMRFTDANGALQLRYKGAIEGAPEGYIPWFESRRSLRSAPDPVTLVTGHWSRLGFHHRDGVLSIDTGCLWGGTLTAVRLDPKGEGQRISLPCPQAARSSPRGHD